DFADVLDQSINDLKTVDKKQINKSNGRKPAIEINSHEDLSKMALLHKDLKCKAPLIEPNLRRNLGKWST
ncbi:hypothetical protein, partial [Acinetobacter baumannii]|uniref:hypothetical protein n=1 Tax=Acinetobacter baumannii TaxID=470 RepID=UPI001A7EEA5B